MPLGYGIQPNVTPVNHPIAQPLIIWGRGASNTDVSQLTPTDLQIAQLTGMTPAQMAEAEKEAKENSETQQREALTKQINKEVGKLFAREGIAFSEDAYTPDDFANAFSLSKDEANPNATEAIGISKDLAEQARLDAETYRNALKAAGQPEAGIYKHVSDEAAKALIAVYNDSNATTTEQSDAMVLYFVAKQQDKLKRQKLMEFFKSFIDACTAFGSPSAHEEYMKRVKKGMSCFYPDDGSELAENGGGMLGVHT